MNKLLIIFSSFIDSSGIPKDFTKYNFFSNYMTIKNFGKGKLVLFSKSVLGSHGKYFLHSTMPSHTMWRMAYILGLGTHKKTLVILNEETCCFLEGKLFLSPNASSIQVSSFVSEEALMLMFNDEKRKLCCIFGLWPHILRQSEWEYVLLKGDN